jgi:hypothetical protein
MATAAEPTRVARLTLVSPAGLPLRKPIAASLAQFAGQVARGRYELGEIGREIGQAFHAPRAAHCRAAAHLLGAEYREFDLDGGHMWMLTSWPSFADCLNGWDRGA